MVDVLKGLFLWVLYSSIGAVVVAFIFILIRMIFKNRIAPRIFCILWFFVIIKLIVTPFAPGSQVSVFNIINYHPIDSYMQDTAANLQPFTDPSYLGGSDGNEQLNSISNNPDQTVLKNDNT
jgi:bla regulator protein BlaR1